jgi:hypothetical protein
MELTIRVMVYIRVSPVGACLIEIHDDRETVMPHGNAPTAVARLAQETITVRTILHSPAI